MKADLETARAKGKRLGRPKKILDARRIAAQGLGWKKIARQLGCGISTVLRVAAEASQRGSTIPFAPRRQQQTLREQRAVAFCV